MLFYIDGHSVFCRSWLFRDGDTVVFFGDSITHGGMYYKFVPGYVEYWPRYREVRAELLAEQEKVYALARPKLRHYRIV